MTLLCWYCGCRLRPAFKTADHVQPMSRGGKDVKENKVDSCKNCNGEKAAMTLEEYRLYVALIESGAPSFNPEQLAWIAKMFTRLPRYEFHGERAAKMGTVS